MDVALATCKTLPEPDFDAEPLVEALTTAGIEARFLAWDDPSEDWSRARLTLLRSTWNYPEFPTEFMDWAVQVAALSDLWNPLPVVRWNVHKRYLLDLEAQGVPVAPTELAEQGSDEPLASILDRRDWDEVVVKPAISAASYRTLKIGPGETGLGEGHLRELAADGDTLVQQYLPSVEGHGERALVWIDGEVTHAVRKTPRFSGEDESVSDAMEISDAELALAHKAVSAIDGDPLYARIDMAPGPGGDPVVMELELIEPSLFFPQGPQALERLVVGIRKRLDRAADA
jgi:hypothetical protein